MDTTGAPERIWADRVSEEIKGWVDWTEGDWTATPYDGCIEYVRADLYAALLAERDALIHDIERAKESESALLAELEEARA